ncbi:FkbM family methyltransferase [bacterium]|nr:FkbM family methyltransferase [bacterium]
MFEQTSKNLLQWMALLPPERRSKLGTRLADRLVNALRLTGPIETNLGMNDSLRISYPEPRHRSSVFGTPADYLGERGALFSVEALLPHADSFIDIGSNLGYFTFFAKTRAPKTPVHFFEPTPRLFSFIEQMCARNGFHDFFGHRAAIGAASEAARFFIDTEDPGRSSLDGTQGFPKGCEAIDVEMIRFADFAEKHSQLQRMLVKVDVENAEMDFLRGVGQAWDRISYLVVEVLLPAHKQGFINATRQASGMHAYYIKDFTLEHSADGTFHYQAPEHNWLFARETPEQLRQKLLGSRFQVLG